MNIEQQLKIQDDFIKSGQSLWLDNIQRDMFLNGTLSNLIKNYNITGLTSNPSIFEQAITGSKSYDESLRVLLKNSLPIDRIAYSLMVEDIQRACDLFSDIYKKTNGNDGYVSIEIPPTIEKKDEIIKWARDLYTRVGRSNVMIKIPATDDGILAEEELIKEGINLNMTLIFSTEVYERVLNAYLNAIDFRYKNDLDTNVFSVASFFVSRIDTEIDNQLDIIASKEKNPDTPKKILSYKGKAAISNSLIAYSKYLKIFSDENFIRLSRRGFKIQKLLWASTSTKNPNYKDTLYIDELCLKDTINTVPQNTLYSFFDHGTINKKSIDERISNAEEIIKFIISLGVDYNLIMRKLLNDGIYKFLISYNNILKAINEKSKNLNSEEAVIKVYNSDINNEIKELSDVNFIKRLYKKDATLWKNDPENTKIIKNSLGWLTLPQEHVKTIKEVEDFTSKILSENQYKYAVLMGMGGSSLAPEVIRSIFQKDKFLKLYVLDSTNPEWISNVKKEIDIKKTLFIFSSKSGGTIEPNSQFKYFYSELKKKIKKPGDNFIAITDKGTSLESLAKKYSFKKIFINQGDIGGRFSALSYFGLIPASLCGCDIKKLASSSKDAMDEILTSERNAATVLGSFISKNYLGARDKLTIILPEKMKKFGLWIEQLIAESTGKENKGIVPITTTKILSTDNYDKDRMFVIYQIKNFIDQNTEAMANNLISSGFPVLKIYINDLYEIGKEFYRWEIATSISGYFMKINPFNQPDVESSKQLAKKLLEKDNFDIKPINHSKTCKLYLANIEFKDEVKNYEQLFIELFNQKQEGTYYSICAYLENSDRVETILENLSHLITRATQSACIYNYGPRYLHSTGQLFKGGANNGIFVILTTKPKKDIKIAGEKYTFGKLCISQAKGDFLALKERKRKVVMIHIEGEDCKNKLFSINKKLENLLGNESEEGIMPKTAVKKNTKQSVDNGYVIIDYPKHGETITSRHYTIRMGAMDAKAVEISIDNGPWQPARNSVGYWWYDWNNITPGTHEIIAKMHRADGSFLISKRRRCKVV